MYQIDIDVIIMMMSMTMTLISFHSSVTSRFTRTTPTVRPDTPGGQASPFLAARAPFLKAPGVDPGDEDGKSSRNGGFNKKIIDFYGPCSIHQRILGRFHHDR